MESRVRLATNSGVVIVGLIARLVFFTCCLILSHWISEPSERFSGYVYMIAYLAALVGGRY
jgi:hypothetical protein